MRSIRIHRTTRIRSSYSVSLKGLASSTTPRATIDSWPTRLTVNSSVTESLENRTALAMLIAQSFSRRRNKTSSLPRAATRFTLISNHSPTQEWMVVQKSHKEALLQEDQGRTWLVLSIRKQCTQTARVLTDRRLSASDVKPTIKLLVQLSATSNLMIEHCQDPATTSPIPRKQSKPTWCTLCDQRQRKIVS